MQTLIYRPWRALILATLVMLPIIMGSAVTHAASASAATGGTGDITAVIMQRFRLQDTALMSSGNAASMASVYAIDRPDTKALYDYEVTKTDKFHAWVASHGDQYIAINTSVGVVSIVDSGGTITASVRAVTDMRWLPGLDPSPVAFSAEKAQSMKDAAANHRLYGTNDVVDSKVASDHVFGLVRTATGVRIVSDTYADPFVPSLEVDHTTPRSAEGSPSFGGPGAPLASAASAPAPLYSVSVPYYPYRAASYADTYALSYNSVYINYNPYGGDCANFVSQALYDTNGSNLYGIYNYSPYWYYSYGNGGWSPVPWRYTPSQHSLFTNDPMGSQYNFAWVGAAGSWSATNGYDLGYMLIGDIHYYDWTSDGLIDHTSIAVSYLSDGTTLVDAHNYDRYHVRYDFGVTWNNGTTYYMDRMHSIIYYY